MTRRWLLFCGIVSSLLYAAMNVFVPMAWPEYSSASQTVSELSAIGAPTRELWATWAIPYVVLVALFGIGVWQSAGGRQTLRISGAALIIYGVSGIFWPPMHLREEIAASGRSMTDSMHIAFTMLTVGLMIVSMGFGAAALGRRFRVYTIVTIALLGAFGALTSLGVPNLERNLPTPWMGVWERLNIGIFLAWIVVLASALLREHPRAD